MNGARSKQHRAALRVFEAEAKQTATMEDMGWRCTRRSRPSQMPVKYALGGRPDNLVASLQRVNAHGQVDWWLNYRGAGLAAGAEVFPTPVAAAMYLQFLVAQQPAVGDLSPMELGKRVHEQWFDGFSGGASCGE